MNFLGHLYFSDNDQDLMYANLYGDFVRGSHLEQFSPIVQRGIKLHRSIDSYIDNHPVVIELRHHLAGDLPKVAGIAIDLYFDHLLSKNWEKFHILSYQEFLNDFYQHKLSNENDFSPEFLQFKAKLIHHDWMSHYPTPYGLEQLSKGVASRLSFDNQLGIAHEVFDKYQSVIKKSFTYFMNDAIPHFHTFHRID